MRDTAAPQRRGRAGIDRSDIGGDAGGDCRAYRGADRGVDRGADRGADTGRRRFLTGLLGAGVAAGTLTGLPGGLLESALESALGGGSGDTMGGVLAPKPAAAFAGGPRTLAFHNLHTDERLQAVYWADGAYRPEGLQRIHTILRDWRTGEVSAMDPGLLDLLHRLHATLEAHEPFAVISGYRSPKTNAQLAATSGGVAKKSFHMRGMAIDVALPGRDLAALRDAAWALQGGGVGYYAKSGFVHLDTGRVRRWNF